MSVCESHTKGNDMRDFGKALDKLWNKAPQKTRVAIKACYEEVFHMYELDSALEIAHFMAQISHECMAGQIVRENMNYRAPRIMQIFGVGKHSAAVTESEAEYLAGRPMELAERVYGLGNPKKAKELGNTKPGDGYKYRGGGMLQLTGGGNYAKRGEAIGYDLYDHPEQLENPTISFMVAAAEFVSLSRSGRTALEWAALDNVRNVTLAINGGTNGLADRMVWLRKWKEELGVNEQVATIAPRAAELDAAPTFLGTPTGKLGAISTAAGGVSAISQVGQNLSTVTDHVIAVQDGAAQVVETVKVIRPFLGLTAQTWATIGLIAGIVVVVGLIAIGAYRLYKLRKEGTLENV